jgi:phage-related protein
MPGWLTSLIGVITGPFRDLWNKVVSLVTTVYRWVDQWVTVLYNDVTSVYNQLIKFADEVRSFVTGTFATFSRWVTHQFDTVLKWAESRLSAVEKYAGDILAWATREIAAVSKWVTGLITGVEHWVISNIWQPLYNDISGAVNWIEREGAYVYDLVTHPEKLVKLILAYVWLSWLALFTQFAKPIISYILHHLRSNIPDLVSVIEDIIASIL